MQQHVQDVGALMLLHPGFFVSVAGASKAHCSVWDDDKEEPDDEPTVVAIPQVFCYQYKNFQGRNMKSDEAHAIFQRACFYSLQASQSTIPALRGGMFFVADTRSVGWHNFSLAAESRTSQLLVDSYPIRLYRIAILYASPLVRLFFALCRALLSAKFQRLAVLYGPRESDTFLETQQLTADTLPQALGGTLAPDDFLSSVLARLQERYENAQKFTL